MLSARLAKKRLSSAIMVYTSLLLLIFLLSMITLFLYVTNQENKENRLQRQEPIVVTVNVGSVPLPTATQVVAVPVVKQAEVATIAIE